LSAKVVALRSSLPSRSMKIRSKLLTMTSVTVSSRSSGSRRPVAEDVVGDLADDAPPLLAGQRSAVERELLRDLAQHAVVQVLVVSVVNRCGPSFAMHAWCTLVFSSAYGSAGLSSAPSPMAGFV
jgi:hypothetical protein